MKHESYFIMNGEVLYNSCLCLDFKLKSGLNKLTSNGKFKDAQTSLLPKYVQRPIPMLWR